MNIIGDLRNIVTTGQPSPVERLQLAMMQAELAVEAMRAGDYTAAAMFLDDAIAHVRALRIITEPAITRWADELSPGWTVRDEMIAKNRDR